MDYSINFADQLAHHLKAFRQSRGLTQAELAVRLGVTQSRIADIETNPGKVSLENLLKVLTALDIRLVLSDVIKGEAEKFMAVSDGKQPKTMAELKAMQEPPKIAGDDW